jgi:hypothetical protein
MANNPKKKAIKNKDLGEELADSFVVMFSKPNWNRFTSRFR